MNDCPQLDPLDYIPALIDQNHLNAALAALSITVEQLLVSPRETYLSLEFPPGFQLNCLRGRDQVQAGAKILPPGDKRWTVDLYLASKIYFTHHLKSNPDLLSSLDLVDYNLKNQLNRRILNRKGTR